MSTHDEATGNSSQGWLNRLTQWLSSPPQTREALITLLNEVQQSGLFSRDALDMIEGALEVSDIHVRDIMIPRAQMVVLAYDDRPEEFLPEIVNSGHSRFPVIGDNRDDVQGILLAKDLLTYYAQFHRQTESPPEFNIRDLLRPVMFIPESKRLNVLLREFRSSRNHMAVVVDEYGGVAGLVTIEDVIEEIIGDIDDEHDSDTATYIKPREPGRYTVRALTPIEIFNDYFKSDFSDEEFDTIGGVLLKAFGHLPKRNESIELNGFHFQVVRADRRRLHLLRVQPLSQGAAEDSEDEE